MSLSNKLPLAASGILLLAFAGCGADSADVGGGLPPPGNAGVSQAGAQDFARFRAIVDEGNIPAPEVLDELGFLAEHKLDLPPADCGERICVHAKLGVMGNMISGANCTMVFLGMNTPVKPDEIVRLPTHVVLALEHSQAVTGSIVTGAVRALAQALRPEDRISAVRLVAGEIDPLFDRLAPNDRQITRGISDTFNRGGTPAGSFHDGLRRALEHALPRGDGFASSVVMLTSGAAPSGELWSPAQTEAMVRAYAARGARLTIVAVDAGGGEARIPLLRRLAIAASGTFYTAAGAADAERIFASEAETTLAPLARDLQLTFDAGPGYVVRAVYGSPGADMSLSRAIIRSPALYLARRMTSGDVGQGRRGGGGGMVIELVPKRSASARSAAATITGSFEDGATGERRSLSIQVDNPLPPGEAPASGQFSDATAEKAFVMINVYAGLDLAVRRAADGDGESALVVLEALSGGLDDWLANHSDPDIEDDRGVVRKLEANVRSGGLVTSQPGERRPPPPNPWPRD